MHHLGFVCSYGPVVGYLAYRKWGPFCWEYRAMKAWSMSDYSFACFTYCQQICLLIFAFPVYSTFFFVPEPSWNIKEPVSWTVNHTFIFDQINVFHLGRTFMVTEHQLSSNYLHWEAICSKKRPMGLGTDLRLMPCTCVSNSSWQKRSLYAVVCVLLLAVETVFVCFGRELSHPPIKDCMSHAASRLELLMKACDQSVSQRPPISAGVPQTKKFSSPLLAAQSY